ncbi:uncharacterized protein LOC126888594 [Diabrotica virgifera virgifera]|uniref:Reverse transcriptase n=1 Tax=Diabrotica virgifera virgifera TaxID=50390 RepID=A0ABM5KRT8_DIAVI|nr:uncharacterized protein LOC126888594 [Diabrotica virgifera virgifera]
MSLRRHSSTDQDVLSEILRSVKSFDIRLKQIENERRSPHRSRSRHRSKTWRNRSFSRRLNSSDSSGGSGARTYHRDDRERVRRKGSRHRRRVLPTSSSSNSSRSPSRVRGDLAQPNVNKHLVEVVDDVHMISENDLHPVGGMDLQEPPNKQLQALLGDECETPILFAPSLHNDIASRWNVILRKGALTDSNERRDARLSSLQSQVGAGIAAIGKVLSSLYEKGEERDKENIQALSDAGRILADVHYQETISRRDLVLLNINKDLRDTLSESPPDEWLFGGNLEEAIKAKKTIDISSQQLRSKKGVVKSGSLQEWTAAASTSSATKDPVPEKTRSVADEKGQASLEASKYAGRLKFFINRWKDITKDNVVLSWLEGYSIPLISMPNQTYVCAEHKWSPLERLVIKHSVNDLLLSGAISSASPCENQFVSNIFLVPKTDGSYRLVLNLKNFNRFVKTKHFKIEDRKTVSSLIIPNCYMATVDLKDAYLLVPIREGHRKYLRFFFEGSLYQYNSLPFGLSSAPFVFTKIMRPVVSFLRERGYTSVIYLDDIWLLGNSFDECLENVQTTVGLLEFLGFVINYKKCCLIPSQRCTYLGFTYNSLSMLLGPTDRKRKYLMDCVLKITKKKSCKIRELSQLIGKLVAVCPGIKYGFLYTKILERAKFLALRKSGGNYNAIMTLPESIFIDLRWWTDHLPLATNSIRVDSFCLEIFSDASLTGWGIYQKDSRCSYGFWSEAEAHFHINYLELLALFFGLKCYAGHLKDCHILCRVDNTTAMAYVNRMGSIQHPNLNALAREIWQWCEQKNIYIRAAYIPSVDNVEADIASRQLKIETEWSLSNYAFHKIVETFGVPTIDLFASRLNKKCKRFVSWLRDPEACSVDAFTICSQGLEFYAFPPFSLVLKVLQKIVCDQAEGIVVAPFWPSQPWYPLFLSLLNSSPAIQRPFPGGREVVLEALRLKKVPAQSLDICVASVTTATINQYASGLKAWWEFCQAKKLDPYTVEVANVLIFLAELFNKGASYSLLNTYRSAIAQISGPELAQDFRLKRFCKGVFGLRPTRPKYEFSWDPAQVLDFVRSLETSSISLELLSLKCCILLALATGQRIQTLHNIEILNIQVLDKQICIKVPSRLKTSGYNKSQPFLIIPFFDNDTNICVARTLVAYLERTRELRGSCQYLFITFKKPHHRATRQTIGRWLKNILRSSGIDTNTFSAHSTRHAATSAAARKGISFDTIRLAAGWSERSRTFATFYNRPLAPESSFARAVLSSD